MTASISRFILFCDGGFYGEGISKDYNVHYGFPEGNFIMYDIQNSDGVKDYRN